MSVLTGHDSPLALAAQPMSPWVLSSVLTGIGLLLLVGLGLMYAMRRREGASKPALPEERRALEDLLSDAEELTGRLATNLDTKAARLERLIAQADERLARLERTASPDMPRIRAEGRTTSAQIEDDTGPLNRRVYALADKGLPPVEIAKQLSQQVGQVELILALRRP